MSLQHRLGPVPLLRKQQAQVHERNKKKRPRLFGVITEPQRLYPEAAWHKCMDMASIKAHRCASRAADRPSCVDALQGWRDSALEAMMQSASNGVSQALMQEAQPWPSWPNAANLGPRCTLIVSDCAWNPSCGAVGLTLSGILHDCMRQTCCTPGPDMLCWQHLLSCNASVVSPESDAMLGPQDGRSSPGNMSQQSRFAIAAVHAVHSYRFNFKLG